jgi:hypothetical protein
MEDRELRGGDLLGFWVKGEAEHKVFMYVNQEQRV